MKISVAKFLILLLFFAFSLSSCSDWRENKKMYEMPPDESTTEERERIYQAIRKIESYSRESGYNYDFRRLPIIVRESGSENNRRGSCYWNSNREGLYIIIYRKTFTDNANPSHFDVVFGTLLHELGHCYLGRTHSSESIRLSGHKVRVFATDSRGGPEYFLNEFPVSIMHTDENHESPMINMPASLQKYYVSELIGVYKARSVEDVAALKGVKFVKSLFRSLKTNEPSVR